MARKQSSFNYDDLDSATQDFLRQKEGEINPLLDRRQLLYRYRIGKKLVEVQKFLEEKKENCYYPWLKEVFTIPPSTIDEHTYCYTYTNEYLGGIAALEANPKIKYSVLFKLGRPKTPENIKQQFAVRIKSGEEVTHQQLTVLLGNTVQLKEISWQTYEAILEEMGEGYAARLAYNKGTLS